MIAGPGVRLGDPGLDRGALGGKGAGLDRLVEAGCPVPAGAVVTHCAYRMVEQDPAVQAVQARIAAGEPVPASEVDDAFLAAAVPAGLQAEILDVAGDVAGGHRLAVRSSASAEDTAAHSFAGQYRSFLDVDLDGLLEAVRLTWASLWHPAPCAYRRAWGIDETSIAMAVVIMRMVDAEQAGVVFTVDPLGDDRIRVEAVEGLGESLVSGGRTPTVWHVARGAGDVSDRNHAGAVPPPIETAGRWAERVERLFGAPQDVEWAYDGERVWLVQSRPVTARSGADDGCDTPVDEHELTPAGIGEMLPGVLPPLLWDVDSFLVEEALRSVLDEVATIPAGWTMPHLLVRRVGGRAAMDLDALKLVASRIPGGSVAELERQYFGGESAAVGPEEGLRPGRLRSLYHGLRAAGARQRARQDAEIVIEAADGIIDRAPDLAAIDTPGLLTYRARLIDVAARAMANELATAAGAAAAFARLEATLERHLGDEASRAAQEMTSGAGAFVLPRPEASRAVFAGPRWDEGAPSASPVTERQGPPDRRVAVETIGARMRSDPRWRRTRWLTGQFVDVRWHVIRRLADDATHGLALRERAKAAVLLLGGEVRRVHLEIGSRLVRVGVLERADDVDLLRDAELRTVLSGGSAPAGGELARRRRWLSSRELDGPLPSRFVGRPPPERSAHVAIGDVLHGFAASPGRYRGSARHVAEARPEAIRPGEVLVARATDAAWSPLFVRAGAVVVERGGPLSHAAIVARELGVPAVLGVTDAAALLDGRTVVVDGDRGEVVVEADHP
jgi:phosphohistidine swiveling domain-containing protein